jgi:hypothetical protein
MNRWLFWILLWLFITMFFGGILLRNVNASYRGRLYLIHKAESRFVQVGLEHKFNNFLKYIEGR